MMMMMMMMMMVMMMMMMMMIMMMMIMNLTLFDPVSKTQLCSLSGSDGASPADQDSHWHCSCVQFQRSG